MRIDKDFFTLTCKSCGHEFGLTNNTLYEMQGCPCPNCGQSMNSWTFYRLKRAYFDSIDMVGQILALGPFKPDEPNFEFRISGDPAEPEDVRLLRFLITDDEKENEK